MIKKGFIASLGVAIFALTLLPQGCSQPSTIKKSKALASYSTLEPQEGDILDVQHQKTVVHRKHLDYVVKSKIYQENPNHMYLTMRGGGMSVYDISTPVSPKIIAYWNEGKEVTKGRFWEGGKVDVEGQDRLGNLLVVVERKGFINLFNIEDDKYDSSKISLTHLSRFELPKIGIKIRPIGPKIGALHTKIFTDRKGRRFAIVTATWSRKLVAINISNPKKPIWASSFKTKIWGLEGIYLKNDHAYLGGFISDRYMAVDISDPYSMKASKTLYQDYYGQMVSEMAERQYPNIVFTALWYNPGGIAAFDVSDPKNMREVGHLKTPLLEKSNRVKIQGNYAFLPLETTPGGLGIVDIRNPAKMKFVLNKMNVPNVTLPYTLTLKGDFLYLFGSKSASMAIFKIMRKEK